MTKHPLSDLDAEIRDHIERETRDNIDRGMAPDDARCAALRKFGNPALVLEDARAVWIPAWLDHLRQDARYAVRMLRRQPGFSIAAIATLALGIGLTTAVFSLLHNVLFKPLPFADSDRIVIVSETWRNSFGSASAGHFHDWTEQATVWEATAAGQAATFNLAEAGDPERVAGLRVTPGYFDVAYMAPAAGRYFSAADVAADARLVVLSHGLWLRRFDADPSIVGKTIRLGGEPHLVVGVTPATYALTDPSRSGVVGGFSSQLWTPLVIPPERRANYGNHAFLVLGKLKPGVALAAAQADLERVTSGIARRNPEEMEGRGVIAQALPELLVRGFRTQFWLLFAISGAVLTIGCVNIGSLLLARATMRRREIAIRASLGGGKARIVRQLLVESLVLALPGGAAAIGVAAAFIQYFVTRGPAFVPRLRDAGLQIEVLAFATMVTILAAIAFGLVPALRAARLDLQRSLRDAGKPAWSGRGHDRVRSVMVVAEIATTVVLLAGTGLLLRSASRLSSVPFGFDAQHVLTARIALPAARYQEAPAIADAYRRILEDMRASRGVEHAGAATTVPLIGGSPDAAVQVEGRVVAVGSQPSPHIRLFTDGYFAAMGIAIVRGRAPQAADIAATAPPVVVINERLAAALWPGEDAIGKRLSTWTADTNPEWRVVVGVAADVRTFGQAEAVPLELSIPYTQAPSGAWNAFQRGMVLVIRTRDVWPADQVAPLRRAVAAVDATVPLYDVRPMDQVMVSLTATRRFYLRLILLLAAAGLGLAMLGTYGVIAYFVADRTPEIGLRMAIGARPGEVVGMVMQQGLRLLALGAAIGVPAALLLSRAIRSLLFEIEPTDPVSHVAAVALLMAMTALACALPAARAARVDPITALRHD
jgi:predicted permease